MAQYTPSFVNLSGATQALGNSMVQAAQMRYQQDQLMQAQIDDFQKNYNPNKLRDQDLPVFTSAFQKYKEAALRYSRLNRGGGKPEEIAAASAIKDRTLNEMNDLYRKSTMASSKEAEYTDWMKNARVRGYMIPDELSANYSTLRNSSARDIDVENIKSAWDYDFTPKEVDIKDLTDAMDKIGGGLKEKGTTVNTGREYGQTAGGKKLYYDNIITMSGRNPNAVVTAINAKSIINPAVHNAAKMSYDNFKQSLAQNDQNAIKKLEAIKQDFNIQDINSITPAMIYGYDFYAPVVTGMKEDKSRAEQIQQAENEAFDRSYKAQSLRNKDTVATSGIEQPSEKINSIMSKGKGGDYTSQFAGYRIRTINGPAFIDKVLYGKDPQTGKEAFSVTIGGKEMNMEPSVFNEFLVFENPEIKSKGSVPIKNPRTMRSTKQGNTDPAGLGL
jgi:hypothetical protein